MKRHALSFVTAAVLVVVLVLYLVCYQVRFNEIVVLTTFKRIASVKEQPGLYFKWPQPIQTVHRYDRRLQVLQTPLDQCMIKGATPIIIDLAVGWRIADGELFHRKLETMDKARRELAGQARNSIFVFETHPLNHLISPDEKELKYDQIEAEMKEQLNRVAPAQYGIEVDFIRITRLSFPEDVSRAILDGQKETLEKQAEQMKAQGENAAKKIVEDAKQERDKILAKARGEAEAIKGQGDAEAARHYSVFAKNSDLAIFLAKLKALQEIRKRTTLILDTRTSPYNLLEMKPEELKIKTEPEATKGK